MNNVVIVSGGEQRDSAIPIHVSILPYTPLPSSLAHNAEQSSLSCTHFRMQSCMQSCMQSLGSYNALS